MLYGICFIVALGVLLWSVATNDKMKINLTLLLVVTAIGDGGFYAMATSNNLETAILANKLAYVIAIFSPMLLLFCVCDICKIKIRHKVEVLLYTIQTILYLCVCTMGRTDIFYKSVQYNVGAGGAYLTKTYGPVHSVYLLSIFIYLTVAIVIAACSVKRKNRVSAWNVDVIILVGILLVGSYMLERVIHLDVELMPFVFTVGVIIIQFSITRISRYSVEENSEILESQMEGKGYIVFSKNLHYMGCNEYAETLFPELKEWEFEKKIPGNGGRFNTFLRQPFMKYVKAQMQAPMNGKNVIIKDKHVHYIIRRLHYRKRHLGYVIELLDMTSYLSESLTNEVISED